MMSFTSDGQLDPSMLEDRDKDWGISTSGCHVRATNAYVKIIYDRTLFTSNSAAAARPAAMTSTGPYSPASSRASIRKKQESMPCRSEKEGSVASQA